MTGAGRDRRIYRQSLSSTINTADYSRPRIFDLLISDEAHRSISGNKPRRFRVLHRLQARTYRHAEGLP